MNLTNLHIIECNYRRGSIGGDGCICVVVNKNEIQRLISLEEESNQAFENAIRNRDEASAECEKLRTTIEKLQEALLLAGGGI